MRSVRLSACLFILTAAPLTAQHRAAPKAGDWVRLSTRALDADPAWMVGSLATVTERFVVIQPIGAGALAIPHSTLTRVELQTGWQRHTRRGALLGGAAGSLVSLGLVLLTDCEPACLAGPAVGFALGAAVGHGRNRLRWERLEPALLKPHTIASARGVHILTIAF